MFKMLYSYARNPALALIMLVSGLAAHAQDEQNFVLATGSTDGTYHPVGVALATLTKVKLLPQENISMSAVNSAGSEENIQLLRDNEVQFAILQGLYGHYAMTGSGPLEADGPQHELRSVTMLWQNVEQFVVRKKYVNSGNISDLNNLKGLVLALGEKDSGTLGSNEALLSGLGIDIANDFELFYGNYSASADALEAGEVEAMNTAAGVPTTAMTKTYMSIGDQISMLEVTDGQIALLDQGKGLWSRYVIESDTYPGQSKAVNTVAQPNFLAVRADVPEQIVYQVTKTIYENLPFLQAIHKATNAMSAEKAMTGLPVPLHPGAAKYFIEAGIEIPNKLLSP